MRIAPPKGFPSHDVMRLLGMTSQYELHEALAEVGMPLPSLPTAQRKAMARAAAGLLHEN